MGEFSYFQTTFLNIPDKRSFTRSTRSDLSKASNVCQRRNQQPISIPVPFSYTISNLGHVVPGLTLTRNWGAPLARQLGLVQQMTCEQYQRRLCLEDYTIDMEVGIKWTKKAMMESRRSQLQVWEFCKQNLCCNCKKKDLYIFS